MNSVMAWREKQASVQSTVSSEGNTTLPDDESASGGGRKRSSAAAAASAAAMSNNDDDDSKPKRLATTPHQVAVLTREVSYMPALSGDCAGLSSGPLPLRGPDVQTTNATCLRFFAQIEHSPFPSAERRAELALELGMDKRR